MSQPEMVRVLQERAARALPAEHVEIVDGWWLRHSPGCAWWIGTVVPHGDASPDELLRRIVLAEDFYARRGTTARFQISPPACSDRLDSLLAGRGYRSHDSISIQVASTADVVEHSPAGSLRVRTDDCPTQAWFDLWHSVNGHGDPRPEWEMLLRVDLPSVYACALIDEDVVAVGRAVADSGWVGVFNMATSPGARGKGAARTVLAGLAEWSQAPGAERMYLQVESENATALRLYERSGFGELSVFHYRSSE
jgi:ribosomal protein S18 acetylase RimI-like enzyme